MKNFSRRLEQAMAEEGKSMYYVAKDCGISPSTVAIWIKGVTSPDVIKAGAVAKYLRISDEWLLKGTGNMRPGSDSKNPLDDMEDVLEKKKIKIPLEKLEDLKSEIIKEIEELTEGTVSEFHIENTGMYVYFKVAYMLSLCFPEYQLLSIDFEKRRVYCTANVLSFSCVRKLFL